MNRRIDVTGGPVLLVDHRVGDPPPEIERRRSRSGAPFASVRVLVHDGSGPIGEIVTDHLSDDAIARQVDDFVQRTHGTSMPEFDEPITVVVATKDRPESLTRCLASLDRQTATEVTVIVVENTPAPGTAQEVVAQASVHGRRPRYVHEPRPGLAFAHNAGLAVTTDRLVAFTDDDVVADPAWLTQLGAEFAMPDVACVTGLIYPAELESPWQLMMEQMGLRKSMHRTTYRLSDRTHALLPFATGLVGSGANMAFKTEVLKALGGFDVALGTGTPARGGDDLAVFFDVLTAGHTIVYQPAAMVRHEHPALEADMRLRLRSYGIGLGAHLTRAAIRRPRLVPEMIARAPAGLAHLARIGRVDSMGPQLPLLPRFVGLCVGPVAYARSRFRNRRT